MRTEGPVRKGPERGSKELYQWLDRYAKMPYSVRRVVALPIAVEIAMKQCSRCHRFLCRCLNAKV